MKLHSLMFVLPNLFTASSILCGFYALTLCSAAHVPPAAFYQAALAIFFGIFFDGFDGRVARLTRTQSQFGVQLDSLADVVTFGVAPALLLYKWALEPLGIWGILIAFFFLLCGALRLARFNVLAQRATSPKTKTSTFFVGLPIPLAAGVVVSWVFVAHEDIQKLAVWGLSAHTLAASATLFLALLMVSTVRYRTFKELRIHRKSILCVLAMLLVGLCVSFVWHPGWVLVVYFSAYLLFGLLESLLFWVGGPERAASLSGLAPLEEKLVVEQGELPEGEEGDEALG
ncbi:MAG: CDP-diacylglycerol--serine O-phosphatidyltransferase [Cystobacterineae bacterium]|nr:CDP-diacylglycerol--serine O-phosphatidyltransferase [Cystobacterineae bacterium]